MNNELKKLVIILLLSLITFGKSYSQFSADVDGRLDISPVNGNLTYTYPISNNSIDGYPLTVNLNYSNNVSMSAFSAYVKDTSSECLNCDGWSRMSRVHPAWIVGVNGFAVQILGYKQDFFSFSGISRTPDGHFVPNDISYDNEGNLIWQVEGFDYCNRMHRLMTSGDQDVIKILRSDGSILELRNKNQKTVSLSENDASLYTGYYYESGVNTNGFAVLDYDTTDTDYYYSDEIKNFLPADMNRNRFYPRILRYYPGDGLEYVFREYIAPYGLKIIRSDWIDAINVNPTVFDLVEINSSMGTLTQIDRFKETGYRSILKGFKNHVFNWGDVGLTVETLDRTIKTRSSTKVMIHDLNSDGAIDETIKDFFEEYQIGLGSWGFNNNKFPTRYNYVGEFEFLDLITDIYDAENRHTRFTYQDKQTNYNNFTCIPNDGSLLFQTFRIDTICEPTKTITIGYHYDNNIIYSSDLDTNSKLDFDHINVVDSIVIPPRAFPKLSKSKVSYEFTGKTSEYDQKTKITYFTDDYRGYDRQDSTRMYFVKKIIPAAKTNLLQEYYSPAEEFLYPVKVENFSGDLVSKNETVMKSMDELQGLSKYFFYPEREITKICQVSGESDTLVLNNTLYEYEFETINDLSDDDTLINAYGQGLKSVKKITLRPDDATDTLYKETTDFINLKYMIRNVSNYTEKNWNRFVSDSLTRWLRNQMIDTTVLIFDTQSLNRNCIVPPLWGIKETVIIQDGDDNILGGKINHYDTAFSVSTNPSNRRGAIISDTIIGKDGARIFGNKYEYTGGWYRNFLKSATNTLGVGTRLYYNYSDIGALSGNYPIGKKLLNTNVIFPEFLSNIRHEFEAPVASDSYVRKYYPEGLMTDTLRKFIEKTYYGQIAASIDENGWYWQNEYDKNGRLLYNWHPFDFPDLVVPFLNPQEVCSPLLGKTTITTKRFDTITTINHHISYGGELISTNPYDITFGNRIIPSLPLDQDSLPPNQVQIIEENEAVMYYVANDQDAIQSMKDITEAYLSMLLSGSVSRRNIIIEVSSDRFGFRQRIILGGRDLALLPGDIPAELNPLIPELRINLLSILDSLRTLSNGEAIEFRFRSFSPEGIISVNQFADDNEPRICVRGTASDPHQDYTYRYIYNDSLRTTDTYSKIDDLLHTTRKSWVASFPGEYDGRYTMSRSKFMENNLVSNSYLFIGNPANPSRIDSIRSYYDGGGNLTKIFDQLDYESEMIYDHQGRLTNLDNCDYTSKSNSYLIGNPSDMLDLEGNNFQDFYGVCSRVTSTNEEWIRVSSYYDAMGKLRRTIADTAGLAYMTKYEYDISGNLKYVIDPEGDSTKYWYDDFNRVIYKYNPDIDFVSSAYDKLGQLRFSQTKVQAESNKVSFYEYDDLGRTLIIGEAQLDTTGLNVSEPVINNGEYEFSRLTELLDPDVLNYSGYGTNPDLGIPTANRTLWLTQVPEMPKMTTDFVITSSNLPDSSYIDFGYNIIPPYIRHSAAYYEPLDTVASVFNFEDISVYPQFIRNATWYDDLPVSEGSIWGTFPEKRLWDSIAPRNNWDGTSRKVRNLKGRQAAVAYRDNGGEPFHFLVFSYDPRGRVEAILRYNENLGYDGVYYTYNSQNKVLKIKAVDPLRQYVTWYGYDDNGRVDSVWTKLDSVGSGFGIETSKYPSDPTRPDTPDIVYYYNKRGGVDSTIFVPVNVRQRFVYNSRGWLDSMVANRLYDQLFIQVLERDGTGLVVSQLSQNQGQDPLVQDYTYDRLKRLTAWTDQNQSTEFSYDKLGNRKWTYNGTDTSIYTYSSVQTNRLAEVQNLLLHKQFQYNFNGAVSFAVTAGPIDTTFEYFNYNASGSLKGYTRQTGDELRKWLYHQSSLGGREQKRLVETESGDTLGRTYAWVYYILGAGGTQLARWHGRQTSDSAGPEDCGRRVYMYPHSYLTNGGELTVYPDSTKEYHITDALGSVRTVIKTKDGLISCQGFDYKPFGDSLSFENVLPRQSFGNEERDEEMGYYQMGRRLYDPAIGRFMAVDQLFESFPTQSPYAYAFNSPLSWSDPSGLAPEKERRRDRVLISLLQQQVQESIEWTNYITIQFNYFRSMTLAFFDSESYNGIGEYDEGGARIGEGGGGGGNQAENGQGYSIQNESQEEEDLNDVNQCNEELKILRKDASAKNQEAYCRIYRNRITGEVIYDDVAFGMENSNSVTPSEISLDGDEWEILAEWHSHYGKPDDDGGDILNNADLFYATINATTQIVDDDKTRMVIYIGDKTKAFDFNRNNNSIDKVQLFLNEYYKVERSWGNNVQEGHIMSQYSWVYGGEVLYSTGDRTRYEPFPYVKEKKP